MRFDDNAIDTELELESTQTLSSHPLKEVKGQINETDGHEYLEHPSGSDSWYYRKSFDWRMGKVGQLRFI
jgi:hypothetical protein